MAPRSRSGSHPGRALAALAVLVLIMLFSITGSQTFHPGNWHNQFKVGLGLDLSSGTQIVMQATTAKGKPSPEAMQQAVTVLESRVNGTGNSGAQVQPVGDDLLNVTIPGKAAPDVIDLVKQTAKLAFRQVYLYQGYTAPAATPSASPSAQASGSPSPSSSAKPSASPTSSASPKASTQAEGAALASPAATPTTSATAKASASASPTPTSASPTPSPTSTSAVDTAYGDATKVNAATKKLFNQLVCTPSNDPNTVDDAWKKSVGYTDGLDQWDRTGDQIVSCDASGGKYVLGPAVVEGTQLSSVSAGLDQNSAQWLVNITLNSQATKAFGTLTTNQYNNYYPGYQQGDPNDSVLNQTAIVLDGSVQSAPETNGALTAGQFQINGGGSGFTQDEANQLVNVLKFGALPLNFVEQDIHSISPQVGHASLTAGLLAGIIGLGLVVLYLFYYYRGLGIVAVSSLVLASVLAYLSVVLLSRYQNFTMSLSAIAGLVVAIGITADSFIVYFERLRDEVRDGKMLRPAVESGWKRARRTILVSDTVQFIAAILLYYFSVSDVKGFAYTLGLTTLIDVAVVFVFTKPMVTLLAGTKFFSSGHKWSGLDPERLGAHARWRSSTRRTVRTQRTPGTRISGSSGNTSTSRGA